jgi:hypothetical protein
MKKPLSILLLFICGTALAQSVPYDSALFDFWVGDWKLTWKGADGKPAKGTNRIERILGGPVIQENFADEQQSFLGTSITVYNPQQKLWHQAWADNQGSYFDFEGAVDGDKRIFHTKPREVNGATIIQRMVFYDIRHDAFMWDWEISKDAGKTWQLQWQISYARKSGM